jgi:tRNA U38,U39,U40 pseudouridine synthase TruA
MALHLLLSVSSCVAILAGKTDEGVEAADGSSTARGRRARTLRDSSKVLRYVSGVVRLLVVVWTIARSGKSVSFARACRRRGFSLNHPPPPVHELLDSRVEALRYRA